MTLGLTLVNHANTALQLLMIAMLLGVNANGNGAAYAPKTRRRKNKMTGFNTQVGGGMYRLQLETDRVEVFNAIQKLARQFVDTEKPRKVVVSKNENTTVTEKTSACVCCVEE